MVLDLETTAREDAGDFITADDIKLGNRTKPDVIAAYVAEQMAEKLASAACSVDLCRIIHVGVLQDDGSELHWQPDMFAEADMIKDTWLLARDAHVAGNAIVTFNGTSFDWAVLARRSQILGVEIPYWFSLDKYRSELAKADLANVLTFNGLIGFHKSQRYYCRLFGIPTPPETYTGADIPRLYAEGRYAEIEAKNSEDLHMSQALAQRVGVLARVEATA